MPLKKTASRTNSTIARIDLSRPVLLGPAHESSEGEELTDNKNENDYQARGGLVLDFANHSAGLR